MRSSEAGLSDVFVPEQPAVIRNQRGLEQRSAKRTTVNNRSISRVRHVDVVDCAPHLEPCEVANHL